MSELVINGYLIDEPIINILKQVKTELTTDKLRTIQQKGDDIRVTCPVHKSGEESHPSCGVYCGNSTEIEYGTAHCFTCGFSGPLWKFIAACFDKNDSYGKKWLVDNFGKLYEDRTLELPIIDLSRTNKNITIDESVLNDMQDFHPYLLKRHLDIKVCNKFKIKYEPKTQCIVFPVWDEHNDLVMLTRRSVNNKTFIIDAEKEKPVYLYNVIKNNNIQEVTIVESQINCLTLWSWGFPSCALFGTGTQHQYDILNKSGIRHYFLAFDGDNAGNKGIKRFIENIRDDVFIDIIIIPKGKDVNDLTIEEFDTLPIMSKEDWLRINK